MADTQMARQTLDEIEARHQDIIRLEQSIKELHDMFQDISALVDAQVSLIPFYLARSSTSFFLN